MSALIIPRPAPDDAAPGFHAEMALVPDGVDFVALLAGQLEETRALVAAFGEDGAGLRYAPDKWSVREVVGHLADCERVLAYRLLRFLRRDATPLTGFDHVAYVAAAGHGDRALDDVLAELAAVRAGTLALVRDAPAEAFAWRGAVGSGTITAAALAYVVAGHERHHQALLRTRYLPLLARDVDPAVAALIATATALARPYAPGEDCRAGDVAAALRTASGRVFTGVCIDTACSLGFCAEHAAVAEMLKAREAEVRMIVAVNRDGVILAPCGRCRELLWQLHPRNMETWVVLGPDRGRALAELLPER